MKKYLHAFVMCQSMFCRLPTPQIWDPQVRDKMLLFLPVVGLEIGIGWAVLAWLCRYLAAPALVSGLILCAWPCFITGFIHLDGFMDVTDALGSWQDVQRRREILKDSHVGSFAVIGVVFLLLAQFALLASAPTDADSRILLLIPAVSRCCSALAVTGLKPMSTSQYAAQERNARHLWVLGAMLVFFLAAGFLFCGRYALALLGCMVGFGGALLRGYKALDGMNGDISGYALTIGELCGVAVFALI